MKIPHLIRLASICFFVAITALLSSGQARAITVTVDVLDSNTISVAWSGTVTGGPGGFGNKGIMFIDVSVSSSVSVSSNSVVGDLAVGANSITTAYSGYNNPPLGGTLQLRSGNNGENTFSTGEVLTGSAQITFGGAHELTNSMFSGVGAPVYWKSDEGVFDLQGYAVSTVPVPLSAVMLLSAFGLIAFGRTSGLRRVIA